MGRGAATVPAEMQATLAKFKVWRETRPTRISRIPEALWAEATILARQLGCREVSQVLRLHYTQLRQRVEASSAPLASLSPPAPAFVALPGGSFLGDEGPVVEVTRPDGGRMVLRWPAGSVVDPRELMAAFLGGRR